MKLLEKIKSLLNLNNQSLAYNKFWLKISVCVFYVYFCQNISMKNETIGLKLKELRIEKGLTQIELAKQLNLDKSTIAKYERDKIEPSITMLKQFCKFFNVSADYLLGLED